MKKRFIVALAGLSSCLLGANPPPADFTPLSVGCNNAGNCAVGVSPPLTSAQTSCPLKDQVHFSYTAAGGEAMHKTALTALAAGRKLNIGFTTITPSVCLDSYAQPLWITMK